MTDKKFKINSYFHPLALFDDCTWRDIMVVIQAAAWL